MWIKETQSFVKNRCLMQIICIQLKYFHLTLIIQFNNNNNNNNNNLENDTHKLRWDFDIQTDYLISARKPDLIIINKKKKRKFPKLSTLLSQLATE